VIDIEKNALRPFEQDALAIAAQVVEQRPHRIRIGEHLRRDLRKLRQKLSRLYLRLGEAAAQRIVMRQEPLDLGAQCRQIVKVVDPYGAAADLVLIGRTDAAARGADLARPGGGLAHLVEFAVQGQDQRGIAGDAQIIPRNRHALRR
jgi:hypothetical protein